MDLSSVSYLVSFCLNGDVLQTIPVEGPAPCLGEVVKCGDGQFTVSKVEWSGRSNLLCCMVTVVEQEVTDWSTKLSTSELDDLCDKLGYYD